MTPFAPIHARALARHGEAGLARRLPRVASRDELEALPDDRYLAAMAKRVFAAGFRWNVIDAKWPGFEAAFGGFDPARVAALTDADVGRLAQDTRIVRNRPKILATRENAAFVLRVAAEHGSFGRWIAAWPADDVVGLWAALAAGGSNLGGDSGPWFLRLVGKDTFRISPDGAQALVEAGVVAGPVSGKRALAAVQAAFNTWSTETGLPLSHLSTILGCSTGEIDAARGGEEP